MAPSVLRDVKTAMDLLHEASLVHGDLRRPNILIIEQGRSGDDSMAVDSEGRGMLIDFDWVGKEGTVTYPLLINAFGAIQWAPGVSGGTPMKQEHDRFQYERVTLRATPTHSIHVRNTPTTSTYPRQLPLDSDHG